MIGDARVGGSGKRGNEVLQLRRHLVGVAQERRVSAMGHYMYAGTRCQSRSGLHRPRRDQPVALPGQP